MSGEHTATPWSAPGDGSIRDGRGNCIPYYSGFIEEAFLYEEPAIANAAHIVRCVNAHDELVDALREINRVLSDTRTAPAHGVGADIEWCIDHARLALAKAEATP